MLNKQLQTWKDRWVHHPLRTEHNNTTMQLWIRGLHFTHFGQRMLQDVQEPVTEVCRKNMIDVLHYILLTTYFLQVILLLHIHVQRYQYFT